MDIGIAFPQMAGQVDRGVVKAWCALADDGPFSSISAGERITFDNLDGFTLCAAAAALTERVRVLMNVAVLQWHQPALVAKELASIDVVSGGRLDVAVGVGGRVADYSALASPSSNRHRRLDAAVAEVRRLWAGGVAADGAPVGPTPVQVPGPPILASAMGPKALGRAAQWADGVSGFCLSASGDEATALYAAAESAWSAAGRAEPPRRVTGIFVALGPDARSTLVRFATRYLDVFGEDIARQLAEAMPVHNDEALLAALDSMNTAGTDELILVPASADPALGEHISAVVASWRA